MTAHPNRRNLDNIFFLDFDEILVLYPVEITFTSEKDPMQLKKGFAVDGYTKTGLNLRQLLGRFLYEDRKSGKPDECINFITTYWLNK